jgi:hypothetical protein
VYSCVHHPTSQVPVDPEVVAQRNMEMVCSTESIVWGGALEQPFKERSASGVEVRVRAMLVMQAIQVSLPC